MKTKMMTNTGERQSLGVAVRNMYGSFGIAGFYRGVSVRHGSAGPRLIAPQIRREDDVSRLHRLVFSPRCVLVSVLGVLPPAVVKPFETVDDLRGITKRWTGHDVARCSCGWRGRSGAVVPPLPHTYAAAQICLRRSLQ
jgi:hypothetical protein